MPDTPLLSEKRYSIICADVLKWYEEYDGPPFHALLCDPPYHLSGGFMGKDWDKGGIAFKPETWAALAKHLLPGAFGMSFAGSRGWHRVACAIEDAGLRLHPTIFCWAFGSGFPKATRIKGTPEEPFGYPWGGHRYGLQALKPAVEPIIVFQKPYEGKPVDSIVKHGAGALNIEASRVSLAAGEDVEKLNARSGGHRGFASQYVGGSDHPLPPGCDLSKGRWPANFALQHHPDCRRVGVKKIGQGEQRVNQEEEVYDGVHEGYKRKNRSSLTHKTPGTTRQYGEETVESWECVEQCPIRKLDEQSGKSKTGARRYGAKRKTLKAWRNMEGRDLAKSPPLAGKAQAPDVYGDGGGPSRFFHNSDWSAEIEEGLFACDPVRYCAKAAKKEREAGLEQMEGGEWSDGRAVKADYPKQRGKTTRRNTHPTVKPIKLCRWLASLLLPPDTYAPRRILVPFAGSGSEMIAAGLAGFEQVLGIEMSEEYVRIARARLRHWLDAPGPLFKGDK